MTPEGKIKAAVNKVIAAYGANIYKYMPVPAGYGPSSLDYILCIRGLFIAIETKVPGKELTPRQQVTCKTIADAGGKVFIIRSKVDAEGLDEFFHWLLAMPRKNEDVAAWPFLVKLVLGSR